MTGSAGRSARSGISRMRTSGPRGAQRAGSDFLRKQRDDRAPCGRRKMANAGVVADGQPGMPGKRGEERDIGPPDEIDRARAGLADRGGEGAFGRGADDHRHVAGRVERLRQHPKACGRPALCRALRRRSRDEDDKLPACERLRQRAAEWRQRRQRRRVDAGHQELLGLAVDRVLGVAAEIGVRVRGTPGDPRPLRQPGAQQPGIKCGTRRGLQIVDAIETAPSKPLAQGQPAGQRERPGPLVDQHLVEEAELLGKPGERAGCQQAEPVALVVMADRREGPERLNEIAERTEPDDEDAARLRGRRIERLERRKNRSMGGMVGIADRGGEAVGEPLAGGRGRQAIGVARQLVAAIGPPRRLVPGKKMPERRAGREIFSLVSFMTPSRCLDPGSTPSSFPSRRRDRATGIDAVPAADGHGRPAEVAGAEPADRRGGEEPLRCASGSRS